MPRPASLTPASLHGSASESAGSASFPTPQSSGTAERSAAEPASTQRASASGNQGQRSRFLQSKWLQAAGHFLVYLLVRLIFCVIQSMPLSWCDPLARGVAVVLNDWIGFRRKVIHENLINVFPDATPSDIQQWSRQMWWHLVMMACEVAHAPRMIHETNWRKYFSIANRSAIVGAMLDQRPVVLVAGHFGNFELGGYISGLLGVPTYTVARKLDNPYLHDFLNDYRQRSGQYMLPKDGSGDLVGAALLQGHTMTLLGDQYAGDKGVWVNFLGRPASCHKALALFTLTSGAPMMVVGTRRSDDRALRFEIDFGGIADPLTLTPEQSSIRGLTEWYNQKMAEQILQHPEQYWWVHRRWKPKQKTAKFTTAPTVNYATTNSQTHIQDVA